MLRPYPQAIERLHFTDAKGSGLIMYQEKIANIFSPLKTLTPGKLSDADRIANTDLLRHPGAQIISKDTGLMWEVVDGAWSNIVSGVQQLELNCYVAGDLGGQGVLKAIIGFGYTGTPAYQWLRDGAAITGAVTESYVQNPLVDGQKDISCAISGVTPSYSTGKIKIPGLAPVALTGTALVTGTTTGYAGFTVVAKLGLVPYTFSLTGQPAGMAVNQSGNVTYPNPTIGVYNNIRVVVTDSAGGSAFIAFNLAISQGGVAPSNTVAPVLTGTAQVGQTLSVTAGQWNGAPTSFAYSWLENGVVITGAANQNTFVIQQAQLAKQISCSVTATNSTSSTSQVSNSTATVTAVSVVSTKPRFGYAPANSTSTASIFDTLFPSMVELTGSANGGKAGTFSTVASATNYTWLAVLQSAVGVGPTISDGVGPGGFDGANSAGNFEGIDQDPMVVFKTYSTGGNTWNLYRSNYKAINFGPFTLS